MSPSIARTPGRVHVRAVYPGSFDPFTPGHLNVVNRARDLFDEVVALVAVNSIKHPGTDEEERAAAIRAILPVEWTSVTVATWTGLTATYCRLHEVGVIVRARWRSDHRPLGRLEPSLLVSEDARPHQRCPRGAARRSSAEFIARTVDATRAARAHADAA